MHPQLQALLRATQWTIPGRVGRDPEVKAFDSGKCLVTTSIACNPVGSKRDDGSKPDWFKIELWNDEAMRFADTVKKGDLVKVTGRARSDTWTNRNGETVTDTIIAVDEWSIIGAPKSAAPQAQPAPPSAAPVWGSTSTLSDDEVPF